MGEAIPGRSDASSLGQFNKFNYLTQAAASSLCRNGEVRMRRDPDGSDVDIQGLTREQHEMPVASARATSSDQRCTLARNGLELRSHPLEQQDVDFLDILQIIGRYYPHCERVAARPRYIRASGRPLRRSDESSSACVPPAAATTPRSVSPYPPRLGNPCGPYSADPRDPSRPLQ